MIWHWLLYLGSVAGGLIFFIAYQQWFSWFAFVGVLCLPAVSLLVSLPAMLRFRLKGGENVTVSLGEQRTAVFTEECGLPKPQCKYRIRVARATTGESWYLKRGQFLPTEHCGKLVCRPERTGVYDYLGLFRLKIQGKAATVVTVRPVPVRVSRMPALERDISAAWRPKAGGGYSENHELRLYRPGDKLNQIHWKLSAKTGKMIVREPMELLKGRIFLEMELKGTPQVLDQKFGQLLWVSNHLLELGFSHNLRVLTGRGILCFPVASQTELEHSIDILLGEPQATEGSVLSSISASWSYRVGGGEADV